MRCVYCSPRFNGTLYIYVETTQTLTPLMLEWHWELVRGGSVCVCGGLMGLSRIAG